MRKRSRKRATRRERERGGEATAPAARPRGGGTRREPAGSCCGERARGTGASGAGPTRNQRSHSLASRSSSQSGGGADAPVGGEPLGQLVRSLLGIEILEVELLGAEELAGLQLEERGDEHEELAAGLEVELVALGEPLDERRDDVGDGHVGQLELLAEDQGQEQVERALKGIKVERKVTNGDPGHGGRC